MSLVHLFPYPQNFTCPELASFESQSTWSASDYVSNGFVNSTLALFMVLTYPFNHTLCPNNVTHCSIFHDDIPGEDSKQGKSYNFLLFQNGTVYEGNRWIPNKSENLTIAIQRTKGISVNQPQKLSTGTVENLIALVDCIASLHKEIDYAPVKALSLRMTYGFGPEKASRSADSSSTITQASRTTTETGLTSKPPDSTKPGDAGTTKLSDAVGPSKDSAIEPSGPLPPGNTKAADANANKTRTTADHDSNKDSAATPSIPETSGADASVRQTTDASKGSKESANELSVPISPGNKEATDRRDSNLKKAAVAADSSRDSTVKPSTPTPPGNKNAAHVNAENTRNAAASSKDVNKQSLQKDTALPDTAKTGLIGSTTAVPGSGAEHNNTAVAAVAQIDGSGNTVGIVLGIVISLIAAFAAGLAINHYRKKRLLSRSNHRVTHTANGGRVEVELEESRFGNHSREYGHTSRPTTR